MRKIVRDALLAKGAHRPSIPIDWEEVDKMLICGCLGTEIAARFAMHPKTFYDRVEKEKNVSFTEYSCEKRSIGKTLLREAQFNNALKHNNTTMQIWLGKQDLEQKEPETRSQTSLSIDQLDAIKSIFEQVTKIQKS